MESRKRALMSRTFLTKQMIMKEKKKKSQSESNRKMN